MSDAVTIIKKDNIALIRLDNPPVNAAGHALREGLVKAVEAIEQDDAVEAAAIYCAGRTFVAGADIREFGKPMAEPLLPAVCNRVEASTKPIVAVMHGNALGGGLEIALSCQARVGLPSLKLGLPEVNLGLLPGAGGTQRLPRLVATEAAVKMATGGKPVPANQALEMGLLDALSDLAPEAAAEQAARDLAVGKLTARKTSDLPCDLDAGVLAQTRGKLEAAGGKGLVGLRALSALEAAAEPFEQGIAKERSLFLEAIESPEHRGLKHAFFAQRQVAHIPEAKAEAIDIESAGVIGGGTMGSGIATSMLLSKLPVTLIEMTEDRVEFARGTIDKNLSGAVKRGKLSEEGKAALMGLLTVTTDMQALADVDLVVEAVFESMDVKRDVFTKLDAICKQGAVLASNTSYLNVDLIADLTSRPQDVIGLHFFSPAHVMKLLEVVVGEKTRPEVTATGFALAKRLGKIAVRAGVCDGFIGNRILAHYLKSTGYMMLDGADYAQIDKALQDFGLAMGPFAVGDLAGLDIGWAERKRRAPERPSEERYVEIADSICEKGWFGRKTGKGYYIYSSDARPTPNPEVAEIIAEERVAKGITPRSFDDEEIIARYTTAMISEAVRVLEDGIALRPLDVDAVFLFGYGFPSFRGGPLCYADSIGVKTLIERIETYAQEDSHYWQVPALMREMAASGKTFDDMNKES